MAMAVFVAAHPTEPLGLFRIFRLDGASKILVNPRIFFLQRNRQRENFPLGQALKSFHRFRLNRMSANSRISLASGILNASAASQYRHPATKAGTKTAPIFSGSVAWPRLLSHNHQLPNEMAPASTAKPTSNNVRICSDSISSLPSFFRKANSNKPTLQSEVTVLATPSPPCRNGSTSTAARTRFSIRQAMLIFIGVAV